MNVWQKQQKNIWVLPFSNPERKILNQVFTDSVHFLNNLLDSLVKKLGENDFCHLCQEFNANVLQLLQKKLFWPMTTGIALTNSRKV